MKAEAKFSAGGPKPDSRDVVAALQSIWPGESASADLRDDGTWSISAPISLDVVFEDPEGPQAVQYLVQVGKREMTLLVSP